MTPRVQAVLLVAIAALVIVAGALQTRLEAARPMTAIETAMLWVRSPAVVDRAVLSYDGLVADIYWMRAIQHFGGVRRSNASVKRYELLYPLLDLTTSLDPYFNAAYLFGAVFLAEPQPGGAGRPDLAVALLKKGLEGQPDAWRFAEQIAFVHFWYLRDYEGAADWFRRAAGLPGAPEWLMTLEATARADAGDLSTSLDMWRRIAESAESEWMRETALFRMAQVQTYAAIDTLERIVADFAAAEGYWPAGWDPLVRAGRLPAVPMDAFGAPFVVSPSGEVTVSPRSRLHPLPRRPGAGAR